jgi:hypothetical protein
MKIRTVASWFETAQGRLLTMRGDTGFESRKPIIADTMLAAGFD